MAQPPRAFRLGSVLWALLLGGGVVALGGSMLLPSTKSSRLGAERIQQMAEQRMREEQAAMAAAAVAATTAPATAPTSGPSTEP